MSGEGAPRWLRALTLVGWLLVAALVWTWAAPMQWARGCWLGEWPFEQGCDALPSRAVAENTSESLQAYLRQNVGDAHAYVRLTDAFAREENDDWTRLLPWTVSLAPVHTQTLAMQARRGLETEDVELTVRALTTMLNRGELSARAPLQQLMLLESARPHLMARVSADGTWLQQALATWDPKVSVTPVLPFVDAGIQAGAVQPELVLRMLDRLKRERNWFDAYAMWVSYHGRVPAGLYNPGFDRMLSRRGFDWEWVQQPLNRQGFKVDQVSASPKAGMMVEIDLTGRAALPQSVLSQTVLLLGPKYVLRAAMSSDKLKTEEGLVWAVRCAQGGDRLARTEPIKNTRRQWVDMEMTFATIPACGGVYQVALETTAPWEARAGMTGVVFVDDVSLTLADDVGSAAQPALTKSGAKR